MASPLNQLRKPLSDEGFAVPPPEALPKIDISGFKPVDKDKSIDLVGFEPVTDLAGFEPVSDISGFEPIKDKQEIPVGEGSLFEAIIEGPAAGVLDFVESIGYIGKVAGIKGSDWLVKTVQKHRPTASGKESLLEDTVRKTLASTVNSILSGGPGLFVGALSTGPIGAFPGFVMSASTIMSIAEYGRFMDELVIAAEQSGMDLEDIDILKDEMRGKAFLSALAEGGFEAAGNLALGKAVGFFGKRPIKEGVKRLFRDRLLDLSKRVGLVLGAEVPSELATTVVQHKTREATKIIPVGDLTDELFETGRVAGFQSLLMFGGASVVHNGIRVREEISAEKEALALKNIAANKEHKTASDKVIETEAKLEEAKKNFTKSKEKGKVLEQDPVYIKALQKNQAANEELKTVEEKIVEEVKSENPNLQSKRIIAKLQGREGDQILLDEDITNKILKRRIATETLNFALRGHQQAQLIEQGITSSIFFADSMTDVDTKTLDKIKKLVRSGKGKKGEFLLMGAVKTVREGTTYQKRKLRESDRDLYEAAKLTAKYWDTKLEDIKTGKMIMAWKSLNEKTTAAITDVVRNNIPIAEAITKNKADAQDVKDYFDQLEEIDKYGLDNYISKAELGTIRVVNEEGQTIIVAQTKRDAKRKVLEYFKENPDVSATLTLDSSFNGAQEALGMSRRGYWSVVNGLKEAIKSNAKELEEYINTGGVQKAVAGKIRIKPSLKTVGFLKHRKDVLKGEDNLMELLYVYSRMVNKKIALDPAILDLKNNLHLFPKPVQDALINQSEQAKGVYHNQDAFVDNIFASFKLTENMKPFALSRALGKGRKLQANLKLGYRPVAALVNYMGGMGHTYVQYGMEYMKKASVFNKSKEGIKFLQEEEHNLAVNFAVDSGGNSIPVGDGFIDKFRPLYAFTAAELPTRKISISAAYLYAKDQGMNEDTARVFAREAVRFSLFAYNVASMPKIMQSPLGRTVGQFKTYLLQELQFMSQLRGIRILRYMGFQIAMAGPRGYIYFLRSLPFFIAAGILDDWEEWMNKPHPDIPVLGNHIPTASRGLVGILGGDASPQFVAQLPSRFEDLVGPLISDALGLYNKVLKPWADGVNIDISDYASWVKSIAPVMYYWSMLLDSVVDQEGWVRDDKGDPMYKINNNWERILLGLGINPIGKSQSDIIMRRIKKENNITRQNSGRAARAYAKRILQGKAPTQSMVDNIYKYDIGRDAIKQAMLRRVTDPSISLLKRTKRRDRMKAWEDLQFLIEK